MPDDNMETLSDVASEVLWQRMGREPCILLVRNAGGVQGFFPCTEGMEEAPFQDDEDIGWLAEWLVSRLGMVDEDAAQAVGAVLVEHGWLEEVEDGEDGESDT